MNIQEITRFLIEKYSVNVGNIFIPEEHGNMSLNIGSYNFDIHAGVNLLNNNEISFISIRFKTDVRNDIENATNKLIEFFELDAERINSNSDFRNAHIALYDNDKDLNIDLKLVLWDWVKTIHYRYEVELRLEIAD